MVLADGAQAQPRAAEATDPFLWLEEVEGERALAWVRAQNARSLAVLQGDPRFARLQAEALAIAEATDRIPTPGLRGGRVYNFWQDAEPRARPLAARPRSTATAPPTPHWETLLDFDALAAAEKANWVYKGAQLPLAGRPPLPGARCPTAARTR